MDDRAVLGRKGERLALRFLRRKGCKLVTRNYRCAGGELDLVLLDDEVVVFVEVKTRTGRTHADPEDAVNLPKRQRIIRAARYFLQQTDSFDRMFRFDIVAITREDDGELAVEHFIDAFEPAD
ncbi:MAG: YraN family protein [Phycisphaerales bacterium]|nr:YraN family protein [Phycisphaerales bacterium]